MTWQLLGQLFIAAINITLGVLAGLYIARWQRERRERRELPHPLLAKGLSVLGATDRDLFPVETITTEDRLKFIDQAVRSGVFVIKAIVIEAGPMTTTVDPLGKAQIVPRVPQAEQPRQNAMALNHARIFGGEQAWKH